MAGPTGSLRYCTEVRRNLRRPKLSVRTAQMGADMTIGPVNLQLAGLRSLATRCDQPGSLPRASADLSRSLRRDIGRLARPRGLTIRVAQRIARTLFTKSAN